MRYLDLNINQKVNAKGNAGLLYSTSDAKNIASVKDCLEQSVRDFKYITPTEEVQEIKSDLKKIIDRLEGLAKGIK